MNFTLSVKPLADALDLGVIQANISKYYSKSCLAQLTATKTALKINLEAAQLCSEIRLKGSGDEDTEATAFVDCLVLKQLVNTFESGVVTIEYVEGGIVLHHGKSKFSLPSMIEGDQMVLNAPQLGQFGAATKVDQSGWKFIKDYQMYAISMSFAHPVYTKVYVRDDGSVIVGDFDNSIFTLSNQSDLGETCLLPDTIINLFISLPEGAEITKLTDSYRIDVVTDAFSYAAEFKPLHETDPGMGSYNSDMILGMIVKDDESSFKLPVAPIIKTLNQIALLATGTDKDITIQLDGNELIVKDKNVDFNLTVEGNATSFKADFDCALFKSIISNMDAETVYVNPMVDNGVAVGLIVWTENIAVMIGSKEA